MNFRGFTLAALTASRALVSDGSGLVSASPVTATELGALHGLTASRNLVTDGSGLLAILGGTREVLTANRTYYVRTDGSDSNDGLTNSSGGAFATIQHAIDVVAGLDLSTYAVTIKLGNTGTFAGGSVAGNWVGGAGSYVLLDGDTSSAGSYVISSAISVTDGGRLRVQGINPTTSDVGLSVGRKATLRIVGGMTFGACTSPHIQVYEQSLVSVEADYAIDGAATRHYDIDQNSVLYVASRTVTLSGSLNFSGQFVLVSESSSVFAVGASFTGGTITGTRWTATLNGTIHTGGVGPDTMFPGDAAGSASTGGQTA